MAQSESFGVKRIMTEIPEHASLEGDAHHYITRVLRLTLGDELELCDGAGLRQHIRIESINKKSVHYTLLSEHTEAAPQLNLTVITALPKGDRLGWMIQKLTELGASRIVLSPFEHSVSRIQSGGNKVERLARIIDTACAQCGRSYRPELIIGDRFEDLFEWCGEANYIAHPGTQSPPVNVDSSHRSVVIGPEGGFHSRELQVFREKSFKTINLGPFILRTETAALAAAARLNAGE